MIKLRTRITQGTRWHLEKFCWMKDKGIVVPSKTHKKKGKLN